MKFSIKYKLLLTFFVATVAVVGAMLYLVNWSFERGFLQYVVTGEEQTQSRLISMLVNDYQNHGGWDSLKNDNGRMMGYLYAAYSRSSSQARQANPDGDSSPPTNVPNTSGANTSGSGTVAIDNHDHSDPRSQGQRRRRPTRLVVLDKNKKLLFGWTRDINQMELQPIKSNGNIIGYLGSIPSRTLTDYFELSFSERQGREFILIALVTIIGATILLIPLSRNLVKPINRLASATRDLASGNYDIRIPESSSDEIGQLSHNFNSLAKTLEQNEDARRQWIADISHELRTPLSIMRGEIESMQDGIRPVNPDRLNALHMEVMNLNRLIGDLYELSLSDIGALSYHKRVVDVNEIIKFSLATLSDEFNEKNIRVSLRVGNKGGCRVLADPDRLQQLFINLLTNSLRYTDEGGELKIKIGQDKDRASIDFQDSEPGVNEEELPMLFERLYRLESSRNRETGGAGLGLSICRNIVEAHEGTISARRSPIGGLWIKIEFPREA